MHLILIPLRFIRPGDRRRYAFHLKEVKMGRAKVISFINYKGGVAKTTSTYHIGCWLAGRKEKNDL